MAQDNCENDQQLKDIARRYLKDKEEGEREHAQERNDRKRRYAKEQKSDAGLILGAMGWAFAIIAGLAFNSMTLAWALCFIFFGTRMFRK